MEKKQKQRETRDDQYVWEIAHDWQIFIYTLQFIPYIHGMRSVVKIELHWIHVIWSASEIAIEPYAHLNFTFFSLCSKINSTKHWQLEKKMWTVNFHCFLRLHKTKCMKIVWFWRSKNMEKPKCSEISAGSLVLIRVVGIFPAMRLIPSVEMSIVGRVWQVYCNYLYLCRIFPCAYP